MATITTSPLVKTYTLEEFWELPEPSDHEKLELIAGVLYMTPPPDWEHNYVAAKLTRLVTAFLIEAKDPGMLLIPRAAIWTGPATYVEPDLMYFSDDLLGRIDTDHPDTADIVIEVLSPGTEVYVKNTKADTYGAMKVRELWLVDPKTRSVEVLAWKGEQTPERRKYESGQKLLSPILRGFSPAIDEIWPPLPI
ncbi:MAG: Uma2 family endonuclease [Acidobacteriota bacterium]